MLPCHLNSCKLSEVGTLCSGWVRAVLKPRPLLFPDHPHLEPRHFVDEKAVSENHKDYMFLQCILFITEVRAMPAMLGSLGNWALLPSCQPSSRTRRTLIVRFELELYSAAQAGLKFMTVFLLPPPTAWD